MSASINAAIHAAACTHSLIEIAPSPVLFLKAVKNETEIEGFHRAMKRDGIAMVKFLRWLKTAVSTGNETEISIDKKLYEFRADKTTSMVSVLTPLPDIKLMALLFTMKQAPKPISP